MVMRMRVHLALTRTGRIGDLVFCKRYGRIYARQYVVPTPRRTEQQATRRTAFSDAVRTWRSLSSTDKLAYKLRAAACSPPRTGYHLFLTETLKVK